MTGMLFWLQQGAPPPPQMTPLAWALMLLSFAAVTSLVVYCYAKLIQKGGLR
ncbi:MAG: hypothetical protein NZ742_11635 [Acidobacteria bacterium]|nr:hypothetical protein [Acidobacteriota bacterium]MDW7983886.1 hypothetical protein [Acidobacteriota bacterium]